MEVPLVSCIIPTKNRAKFIAQAIRSYQSQTYPNKELIIVDNGDDKTESLIPRDPTIRYAKVSGQRTTGDMRNICALAAKGEFVCHFDSDDWSAPGRVADQIARLGTFGVVTGYDAMFFYDERDGKCYYWQWKRNSPRLALGTSLCYRREWWRHHPFLDLGIGEDVKFFQKAHQEAHRLVTAVNAGQLMVSRVHDNQTSHKSLTKTSYTLVSRMKLPQAYAF